MAATRRWCPTGESQRHVRAKMPQRWDGGDEEEKDKQRGCVAASGNEEV